MPSPASGHARYWLYVWGVVCVCGILPFPGLALQALRGLRHSEARDWFVPSRGGLMSGAGWASWAS